MCNKDRYLSRPDASDTMSLSPPFEEASTACATDSWWSSAWNLMALSDVIGISIKSHYPPMYGKEHLAYKTLNTTYAPTQAETDRTIAVMWTHTNWGVPGKWNPNHFVPLASTVTNHQKSCHSDTLNQTLPATPVAERTRLSVSTNSADQSTVHINRIPHEEPMVVQENSIQDDTRPEEMSTNEQTITYTITEGTTQRGQRKLVSSDGFTYVLKV